MKSRLSRRDFLVRGAIALGAACAFELRGLVDSGETHVAEALASQGSQENTMPHVIVKLWPGRSEADKQKLAAAITKGLVEITGCGEASVSVAIEEIPSSEWKAKVYEPEIRGRAKSLYKKPGYTM